MTKSGRAASGATGTRRKRKAARNGWTIAKEAAFLSALSDMPNVKLAATLAKVGNSTVYAHRAKDAAFRDGWAEAMAQGYARLEIETLERAINGSVRTIIRKDGSEERQVEYSDRLALALLRMHRDTAATPDRRERDEARYAPEEVAELRERIALKLERIRARIEGDGAAMDKVGAQA